MKRGFFIGLSVIFFTCTSKSTDIKSEETKLINTSKAWSLTAQSNNIENILSYWADDAVVMSPGQPVYKGKQAIRRMIEYSKKIPGFQISWEPIKATVSESGDMAWLLETNKVSFIDSTGNRIFENNKAITVWRKDKEGNWKNVADIWNAEPRGR